MKRVLILGLVLVFALALGVVACGQEEAATTTTAATAPPTTAAGATTTSAAMSSTTTAAPTTTAATYAEGQWKFTFNTFFPATNNIAVVGEMWQAEITKRTNGAVQFEYLPGASLTAANKVYDGVLNGISDLGFSCIAYTPGIFPVMELLDMPNGYPLGYAATHAVNDFYQNFKPQEFEEVKMLALYGTGPQVVFTTKKPVRTLEDVKGLVLRSTGVGANIADALGAKGYAAAQNEAYELMSKGVVDGSIAPREVLLGWKQAEVVDYVTDCFSIGSITTMYLIMNRDKWDELPPDIQQVFIDVSDEYVEYWAKVASAYDYNAIEFFMEQPNREVIELSEEESAKWKDAVQPMLQEKLIAIDDAGNGYSAYLAERIQYWTDTAVPEAECAAWVADNIKSPSAQ
jgi:TRAP-type C4-dicarboxylate transport system substrate-binding protein